MCIFQTRLDSLGLVWTRLGSASIYAFIQLAWTHLDSFGLIRAIWVLFGSNITHQLWTVYMCFNLLACCLQPPYVYF